MPKSSATLRRELEEAFAPTISRAGMSNVNYYSPSHQKLIENCRNCGAPPEPVCCYCGTVHDGKTYKQRNLPPPPPMSKEMKEFYLKTQMGIRIHNPTQPFINWEP